MSMSMSINLFNHVIYPALHSHLDGQTIYTLINTFKSVDEFYQYNSQLLHIYMRRHTPHIAKLLKNKYPKCTIYANIKPIRSPYTPVISYMPLFVDKIFVDDPHRYRLQYGLMKISSIPDSICLTNGYRLPPIIDENNMIYTRYFDVTNYEHETKYIEQIIQHASLIKATEDILPYIDKHNIRDKLYIDFRTGLSSSELVKFKGCRSIAYKHPITDVSAFSASKEVRIFTFTRPIENLYTLSNVYKLSLRGCRLASSSDELLWLDNVRILNISYTNIKSLNGLVNIKELDISYCNHLTDTSALRTFTKLRKLTHIGIKNIDIYQLPSTCIDIIN